MKNNNRYSIRICEIVSILMLTRFFNRGIINSVGIADRHTAIGNAATVIMLSLTVNV